MPNTHSHSDHPAHSAYPVCTCGGSGRWAAGPIVNGKPAREGMCYRCRGKGYQTPEDERRNAYYDNHVRRFD